MNQIKHLLIVAMGLLSLSCGSGDSNIAGAALSCEEAAVRVAQSPVPGTTLRFTSSSTQPASATMDRHCLIEGAMNERTSEVDGRPYAIKFRMRLPGNWNEKFYWPVVADRTARWVTRPARSPDSFRPWPGGMPSS